MREESRETFMSVRRVKWCISVALCTASAALFWWVVSAGPVTVYRTILRTEYTQERIWTPLGMEHDGSWSIDHAPDGLEKTAGRRSSCRFLRTPDMATIFHRAISINRPRCPGPRQ